MKLYALLLAVMFAAVMVFTFALTGGCIDDSDRISASGGGKASNENNLFKAQLDELIVKTEASIKASAEVKGDIAALKSSITTSNPVTQTAGENGTNASNSNTGFLNFQYAPVAAASTAGAGVLALLVWTRHIMAMAQLDLKRDMHNTDTIAGLRDCRFKEQA